MSSVAALSAEFVRATGQTTGWAGLFGAAARKLRWLLLSPKQKEAVKLIEVAASRLGAPILDSTSIEDLQARLDALAENPDLLHIEALLLGLVTPSMLEASATSLEPSEEEIDAIGQAVAELFARGLRLEAAIADAVRQIVAALGPEALKATAQYSAAEDPLWFLNAPGVPPEMGAILLQARHAELCFFALLHIILSDRRADPWIVRAVAERWVSGKRGHLRYLASLPGVRVSEDLIPMQERLDINVLVAQAARYEKRVEEEFKRLDESGAPFWPPTPIDGE